MPNVPARARPPLLWGMIGAWLVSVVALAAPSGALGATVVRVLEVDPATAP